ncbi:MAG: PTS transporter subunit EIIC [Eubacteriales bacterium]|nr:PTS transporter subunit EIIC [Eubacteriales bacterium]
MKEKVMDALQRFSKAMFIPVLILPIAGILIAVGNLFTNARLIEMLPFMDNAVMKGFGTLLSGSLVSILNNLGLIFCVGIAVGLANKKKSEAGFTALLGFLVFINAMNKFMGLTGILFTGESLRGTGQAMVMGVQILDMGVFLGIILGIVTAMIHNRFCETEFNNAFQIYGGSRFVFIVLIPVLVVLAVVLTYVWPFVQAGISSLGGFINKSGNFGIFLYGSLERLLIPTGLHHLVYTPFLYTSLGGVETIGGQVLEGARNIYYAEIADPAVAMLSKSVVWDARGISKMFGLIGACLAMYHTARPENKNKIKAILIPAAFTSFIAGVTEPIEFSFMFVAPILFVIHAALSGLSMVAFNIFDCRAIGPNGFIDFLLYNLPLGNAKTHWITYILIGLVFFALYYVIFRILITAMNLKTLGRETEGMEMKLHSKAEYKEKVAAEKSGKGNDVDAARIVEALGGADNITKVDNCYTRLRLILANPELVQDAVLKNETGANGVVKKGNNVQVVYGLKVTAVRKAVDAYLGRSAE